MMDRYAVFGDSYISRLERYTGGRLPISKPHELYGVPGMTTEKKFSDMFNQLLHYGPKYVFLNLGGNDISSGCDPAKITDNIMKIVERLYRSGVKRVYVASIIERGSFKALSGLTEKHFNVLRKAINRRLKKQLREDFIQVGKRLKYSRHYANDQIHPGDHEGGMKVFMYEIVKAFRRTC